MQMLLCVCYSLCIVCSLQDHHASKKLLLIVQVYCDHYINQHMLKHSEETSYKMVLSYADLSVWCFACDSYVHNKVCHYTTHVQGMCTQSSLLTYDICVSPQILVPYIDSACQHKFGSISFTICCKG